MLWVILVMLAAPLQVTRNALQRGLVGDAGPWGATLVRFLFGLPFSLAMFAILWWLTPDAAPNPSAPFWGGAILGGVCQVAATGALLVAMHRAGFAVATVMQQASLPIGAVIGWLALGDRLSLQSWTGIALTTAGLVVLSWPRRDQVKGVGTGALLGLAAGAAFAVSMNGYRQAALTLEPSHPIYSALGAVVAAQTLQSLGLGLLLALLRPAALKAVAASWRVSLGAGFFGAAASACWFGALALAPAGPVRAVGVIEAPIAAAAGRKLFKERLHPRQVVGGLLAAAGVVLTALG